MFPQTICLAVTIIRYNMFLSVFCCMFVEALHLYRMIVIVFGAERSLRAAYTAIGFGKEDLDFNFNGISYVSNPKSKEEALEDGMEMLVQVLSKIY